MATGDDTGGIRLWDQRKEGPFMDMRQHEEYIADMALDPAKKLLLTARYNLKLSAPALSVVSPFLEASGQTCGFVSTVGTAALASSTSGDTG